MRSIALVITLGLALAPDAGAQGRGATAPQPPGPGGVPPPVQVRTSSNRTAVWVGDRIEWVVEFEAAPEVEILADDLDPDRLELEGLEIVEVNTDRDASVPGRVIHRFRYGLVSYEIEAPALTVSAAPVRYSVRRPGQRTEDAQPVGEVVVPPLVLGLRSTVPPSSAAVVTRDDRPVRGLPLLARIARPAGIGLIVLSIVPVGVWGVDVARRLSRARPKRRPRQSVKERRAAFEEIKALDVSSEPDRREAYARLDAWVREQVQQSSGVPAAALTPAELPAALARPPRAMTIEDLQRLLEACERAKYAPDPPPADRWPALLEDAELLLGSRAR